MRFGHTFAIVAAIGISTTAGIIAGCGGDAPPAAVSPTTDTSATTDGGSAATPAATPAAPAAK